MLHLVLANRFTRRYISLRLALQEIIDRSLNRSRQHTSVLVLFAYIVSGFLIEVAHHDASEFSLQSSEIIRSHDCGANEIHLSLDKRHECIACSHLTLRVATTASRFANNINMLECLFRVPGYTDRTLQTDSFHSGSRAPPLSSL